MASKNNFSSGPWTMKPKDILNFRIVTNENRKIAVIAGRIMYIIDSVGNHHVFRGTMTIDPRFDRGHILYPYRPWDSVPKECMNKTHFKVYINENMDYNEWADKNKRLIDKYIEEKSLYIKPEDPILTYFRE